jgi:hypothetical protein
LNLNYDNDEQDEEKMKEDFYMKNQYRVGNSILEEWEDINKDGNFSLTNTSEPIVETTVTETPFKKPNTETTVTGTPFKKPNTEVTQTSVKEKENEMLALQLYQDLDTEIDLTVNQIKKGKWDDIEEEKMERLALKLYQDLERKIDVTVNQIKEGNTSRRLEERLLHNKRELKLIFEGRPEFRNDNILSRVDEVLEWIKIIRGEKETAAPQEARAAAAKAAAAQEYIEDLNKSKSAANVIPKEAAVPAVVPAAAALPVELKIEE